MSAKMNRSLTGDDNEHHGMGSRALYMTGSVNQKTDIFQVGYLRHRCELRPRAVHQLPIPPSQSINTIDLKHFSTWLA
jgi:hypothetical protein